MFSNPLANMTDNSKSIGPSFMALQINKPGVGVGAIFPRENERHITFPSLSMPTEYCHRDN